MTLAMSSAAALARIVEQSAAAIGYAHAVEIGLWSEQQPRGVPAGAWDVDYLMASPAMRDVAIGAAVLTLISDEVFATTLAVACSAVVSIRNETAARAYEGAGFHWLQIFDDALHGPSWLMLRERPALPQGR